MLLLLLLLLITFLILHPLIFVINAIIIIIIITVVVTITIMVFYYCYVCCTFLHVPLFIYFHTQSHLHTHSLTHTNHLGCHACFVDRGCFVFDLSPVNSMSVCIIKNNNKKIIPLICMCLFVRQLLERKVLLLSLWSMCARARSSGRNAHIRSSTLIYVMKIHNRKKTLRNLYEPRSRIFGTEILCYTSKYFF